MIKQVKITSLLIAILAIIGLLTSCGKKMQDYPDYSVEETGGNGGELTVFKTADGLYGLAHSDNGDVIIEPKYGYLSLKGNFAVASMSEDEYNKIVREMLDDAGINEDTSPREYAEKMENIKKHYLIRMGYDGRRYKRLFNAEGKMLKDYAFDPNALWIDVMGDTIVWKTSRNNNPENDAHQLVTVSGETTDIEDDGFSPTTFTYTIDGVMYVKQAGRQEFTLRGSNMRQGGNLYITHDRGKTLKYLIIYNADGQPVDFGNWSPNRWIEGPSGKGIFVELLSGSPDSDVSWRGREQDIKYVNENGVISKLPFGYVVRKT